MHIIDKILPIVTKIYIPTFFTISIVGCGLMYLGTGPLGFGIPLIILGFSFSGHIVQFLFTKRLGILSLISCILAADWMVGALLGKVLQRITPETDSSIPQLAAIVALVGLVFSSIFYIKLTKGMQSPVAREYTWEDFKYDLEDRNEAWREQFNWWLKHFKSTCLWGRERFNWLKQRIIKVPVEAEEPQPKLYLLAPPQIDLEKNQDQQVEEILPAAFVIIDLKETGTSSEPIIQEPNLEKQQVTIAEPVKVPPITSASIPNPAPPFINETRNQLNTNRTKNDSASSTRSSGSSLSTKLKTSSSSQNIKASSSGKQPKPSDDFWKLPATSNTKSASPKVPSNQDYSHSKFNDS